MSYIGESGEISATYRPIGEVETLVRPTVTNAFVATGSVTNGQFGLFQYSMAPRAGGPKAHFHKTFSESFYIVEGTVRLFNGEKWVDTSAGDFLYVPEGGIHAFRNESGAPATMLILFAPGAPREDYFETLADAARREALRDEQAAAEFYRRHDTYWV